MEATYYSETSAGFQQTTRRYITEDRTLHNHRCEIFKSYILNINTNFLAIPLPLGKSSKLTWNNPIHIIFFYL
jgi:hypothetical protein